MRDNNARVPKVNGKCLLKYDLNRITMHPTFDLTGVQTHHLHIHDSTFQCPWDDCPNHPAIIDF